jgi:hypothetical protein
MTKKYGRPAGPPIFLESYPTNSFGDFVALKAHQAKSSKKELFIDDDEFRSTVFLVIFLGTVVRAVDNRLIFTKSLSTDA